VSKKFIKGHNDGYKAAKSWEKKGELTKWIDTIFGTRRSPGSKEYENGRKAGRKDFYS
jgi:hypothetical protein